MMKKNHVILIAFFIAFLQGCDTRPIETSKIQATSGIIAATNGPIIIFKADDLTDPLHGKWPKFFSLVQTLKIKASVGIISRDFNTSAASVRKIKVLSDSGNFEFWNHGYSHSINQFPPDTPISFLDFDGDHQLDRELKTDNGQWSLDYAANGLGSWDSVYSGYGDSSARPVPADYDGDGKTDLSVKTDTGEWLIDYAANGFGKWDATFLDYGNSSSRPVPADYDDDGKADLSVKIDNGDWLIDYAANGFGTWDTRIPRPAQLSGTAMTEFWSLDATPAIKRLGYNPQYDHLMKTQNFFTATLKIPSYSFGTPFNLSDSETSAALDRIPGIKIWMCYSQQEGCTPSTKRVLMFTTLIETFSPYVFDAANFYKQWNKLRTQPYLIIQIHPNQWNAVNSGEAKFNELVSFLKGRGAKFMTAYQYSLLP